MQYEEACTARIQQFDESHSDDEEEESGGLDPWTDSHLGMNSTLDRNSRWVGLGGGVHVVHGIECVVLYIPICMVYYIWCMFVHACVYGWMYIP